MKKIEFTLEAFGPDGLLKDGYELKWYGKKVAFIKHFGQFIKGFSEDGDGFSYLSTHDNLGQYLDLYRRTRTAEEVAMEYFEKATSLKWGENNGGPFLRDLYKGFVQAGMDEMQ